MTVWLIYEMRRPMDRLVEIWDDEEKANKRCAELLEQRIHADGFYVEAQAVKS